jgi:hypothetical protein
MSCLDGPNAEGNQYDFRGFQPDGGGPLTESVSQPTGPRSKNDEWQNQTAKSKRQNQRLFRFELFGGKAGMISQRYMLSVTAVRKLISR